MKAWHFCTNDRKLGHGDDRLIKTGRTLKVKEPLIMCEQGLHASVRIIDALGYAHGPVICRVELGGKILKDKDKVCATERTTLWTYNATKDLNEFACLCAERALRQTKIIDERCGDAIKIKCLWLQHKATDMELVAAWAAAWNAAWDTAWDAA